MGFPFANYTLPLQQLLIDAARFGVVGIRVFQVQRERPPRALAVARAEEKIA